MNMPAHRTRHRALPDRGRTRCRSHVGPDIGRHRVRHDRCRTTMLNPDLPISDISRPGPIFLSAAPWPTLTEIGRSAPRSQGSLADFGRYGSTWAITGRHWPMLADLTPLPSHVPPPPGRPWPILADIGRHRATLADIGRLWPTLADIGQHWPTLADMGRHGPTHRPILLPAIRGPTCADIGRCAPPVVPGLSWAIIG